MRWVSGLIITRLASGVAVLSLLSPDTLLPGANKLWPLLSMIIFEVRTSGIFETVIPSLSNTSDLVIPDDSVVLPLECSVAAVGVIARLSATVNADAVRIVHEEGVALKYVTPSSFMVTPLLVTVIVWSEPLSAATRRLP